MSKVLVTDTHLEDIADAIRGKLDVETTYRPGDMAAAIESILKPDGALVITRNGYQDVKQYAAAQVEVPNSYTAQDEGRVVQSGALVAQTSRTISANGTYDTTTNNEVTVDAAGELEALTARLNGVYTPTDPVDGYDEVTVQVPTFTASVVNDAVLLSGEQVSVVNDGVEINTAPKYITKTITQNGTYDPGDDNAQAYSSVVVNVSGGGGGGEHLAPPSVEISYAVGVNINSNVISTIGADISGYEYSASYEGMNVTMYDLTAGQEYDVSFDFQSTDAGFFSDQYTIGYKVSATRVSSYPTSSTPDSSYIAFTRDLTVNTCSTRFTATASTMYIIFAFVGYSDSRTNYFTISKLKVTEVSA